jgi:hypothetical protein
MSIATGCQVLRIRERRQEERGESLNIIIKPYLLFNPKLCQI